jgi:pimeloyl-ACP methyl ester carboxylesterase
LLFFHGNAEDLGIAYDILNEMRNCLKVSIFAMEYPGYGLYKSQIDADRLLTDAMYVYDYIVQTLGVSQKDIIIFGRSIGSSPATYVARNRNPAALILMSPFKSIKELARDLVGWFLSLAIAERFRNIDLIKEVSCPIFIIHGQRDRLIPYSHS